MTGMTRGLTWLVGFQLLGELISRVLDLPVPGPIIGMLLLFVVLRRRGTGDDAPVVRAGTAVLRHLQLLFVPAGVGVVAYLGVLGEHALAIVVALLGSWLLGLVAVGWTTQALERLLNRPADQQPGTAS